jgi:hypothetical protein
MQTRIRQGIFETNSSSSHSITIDMQGARTAKIPLAGDGKCHIYTGEFGWEVERYSDAPTKASYALTYARNNQELEQMLARVVGRVMGAEVILEIDTDGYIDHQSDDVCSAAFKSEDALEAFIFAPFSSLQTDNDNH